MNERCRVVITTQMKKIVIARKPFWSFEKHSSSSSLGQNRGMEEITVTIYLMVSKSAKMYSIETAIYYRELNRINLRHSGYTVREQ